MNIKSSMDLLWNDMFPRAVDSFRPHPLMFGCDFGPQVGAVTIWLAPEYQSDMYHLAFNLLNVNWVDEVGLTPEHITQMKMNDEEINYFYCVIWKHKVGNCDKLLQEIDELIKGLPSGTDTPVLQ